MALLDLMIRADVGHVAAATVDHGLRPGAADEAEMVANHCAERGVSHEILRPATAITGSLQAEARSVRYALLESWMAAHSLDWLLTAHHADDQLETMLMRLNRSSGVSGLAAIRQQRGPLLRPLLGVRKATLQSYALEQGIPFVHDPSNGDHQFDRVRMRGMLAGADWLDPVAAARSAAALADAEAALEWSVDLLYDVHVQPVAEGLRLTNSNLPQEFLRRLLRRMIIILAPETPEPRGDQIAKAIIQLSRGSKVSIGACVVTGGAMWTVTRAPPRRHI